MAETIPRAEVAAALGVTERTLQNWEGELGLGELRTESKKPEYRLAPLLRWLYEQGERDGSPFQRARTADMEARARLRELELATARDEVVYRSHHRRVVGVIADGVRGWIQGVPGRWTPKLPGDKRKLAKALRALAAEAAADLEAVVVRAVGEVDEVADAP